MQVVPHFSLQLSTADHYLSYIPIPTWSYLTSGQAECQRPPLWFYLYTTACIQDYQ